jgi:hypothetical protein
MKRMVCIGCSNGQHFSSVFTQLMPDWQVYDLHSAGAGNRYITGRLLEWFTVNGPPDRVYLQFSGLWRRDVCYDPTWSMSDYEYQTHTDWFTWLHSGGYRASWLTHAKTFQIFGRQHAVLDQHRPALAQQNLAEIATAIALCDGLGVDLWWSTYYNYIHPASQIITDHDGFIRKWPQWLSRDRHIQWTPIQHAYRTHRPPHDGIHFDRDVFHDWVTQHADQLID